MGRIIKKIDVVAVRIEHALILMDFSILLCAVLANVVLRYVFNMSIFWISEIANYLLVYLILVGSAFAFKGNEHVKLEINWAKKMKLRGILYVLTLTMECAFIIVMVIAGGILSVKNIASYAGTLPVPMGLIYLSAPLSGLFMVSHILAGLVDIRER